MDIIEQKILDIISKAHRDDDLRGIDANKNRLVKEVLSRKRYQERHGVIVDHNGVDQTDLMERDINLIIDATSYIARRSNAALKAGFISKWNKPNEATRKTMIEEMERVLKTLTKLHSIVPVDQSAFNSAIKVLAKNFLYERIGNEVTFRKYNESGLLGQETFTFDNLLPHHLIDQKRTLFSKEVRKSQLIELARKIKDNPKLANSGNRRDLDNAIAEIKDNELITEVPARILPRISRSEIEREIVRREGTIRGLDVDKLAGTPLAQLYNIARQEYQSLDNMNSINAELQSIKAAGPAEYFGISYH